MYSRSTCATAAFFNQGRIHVKRRGMQLTINPTWEQKPKPQTRYILSATGYNNRNIFLDITVLSSIAHVSFCSQAVACPWYNLWSIPVIFVGANFHMNYPFRSLNIQHNDVEHIIMTLLCKEIVNFRMMRKFLPYEITRYTVICFSLTANYFLTFLMYRKTSI